MRRGEGVFDLNIFLIGVIVILILVVLGFVTKDVEWAVFPGMGVVIGVYLTLALWADGSLTEVAGTSTVTIMAASTASTSPWQFISLIPLLFTFSAFLITGYRVSKAF